MARDASFARYASRITLHDFGVPCSLMKSECSSKPVEAGMAPAAFDEKSTFRTGDLMGETVEMVGT